jgi:hypothetical protein
MASTFTPNLNLEKPNILDKYDIVQFANNNFDKIDTAWENMIMDLDEILDQIIGD